MRDISALNLYGNFYTGSEVLRSSLLAVVARAAGHGEDESTQATESAEQPAPAAAESAGVSIEQETETEAKVHARVEPSLQLAAAPLEPSTTAHADWAAEFRNSPSLQGEFGAEANFIAYKKAEREGRVRILKGRANSAPATVTALPATLPATAAHPVSEQTRLLAEYQASAALRGEFRSEEAYLAFKRAERAGRVKLLQGSAVRSASKSEGLTPAKALAVVEEWKSNPKVRAEFRNDLNAYRAYRERFAND